MIDLLLGAAVGAGSAVLAWGLWALYRWGSRALSHPTGIVIRETSPRFTVLKGGK